MLLSALLLPQWPPAARTPRRPLAVFCAALLAATLAGCGAPGVPVARHPVTPQPIADLAARQQGDTVLLSFTMPKDSTDEDPLPKPPSVEVYRATLAPGAARPKKLATRLVDTIPGDLAGTYEKNGHFEFPDALDAAETARAPGEQLIYQVRTRESQYAISADSNSVTLSVYPAPQAIRDLGATVTEQAIVLAWTPPVQTTAGAPLASAPTYRIYRAEIMSAAASPQKSPQKPPQTSPPADTRPALELLAPSTEPQYRDVHFEFGHTYLYSVRSVGPFGSVSVESADSNLVTVLAKDVFPPAAPEALVAVLTPATAAAPAYVELTWAINAKPDLAGYAVYRSEQPDVPGDRLNPELLPEPDFRDTSVVPGRRYFYRVEAVDRAGNESPPSDAVAVDIP